MPRFKNDTGSVLVVNDLGRAVGPFEEFDFPGYDPEVHGPVSGCMRLDAPEEPDGGEASASSRGKRGKAATEDEETSA